MTWASAAPQKLICSADMFATLTARNTLNADFSKAQVTKYRTRTIVEHVKAPPPLKQQFRRCLCAMLAMLVYRI